MSVFVDFVGLNTLVSSTFASASFDNVLTSDLANGAPAVGTIVYTGTSATNDTITVSDGYLGGGVGPVTFTAVGSVSTNTQWLRQVIADANFNGMCTAINDYPGLNLNASRDAATNTITITNLFSGEAGNGSITYGVGTPPFSSNDGFVGGSGIDGAQKLPAINLHRNGPYNFATFKQIRIHENPLTRYQRRNNFLSFTKRGEQTEISNSSGVSLLQQKFGDLLTFTEPSVVSSYHPLVYNLGRYDGEGDSRRPPGAQRIQRFGLSFDYGNHITYFTNDELNKLLLLDDLDDEVYEQIKELYLNGALETNASEISQFEFLRYKQDIYPREINKYSSNTRQRAFYENSFWRDLRSERDIELPSGRPFFNRTALDYSMWSLDALEDWGTLSSVTVGATLGEITGLLQNNWCHFSDTLQALCVSPVYNRLHTIGYPYTGSVVGPYGMNIPETSSNNVGAIFQGNALWQAGEQAGKNPSYNSYAAFAETIKGIGKDYSIIPEFRISDNVTTLIKDGLLTPLPNMLEMTGGLLSSSMSNQGSFYETYSTSDFLKHFAKIKDDHEGFVDPAGITLTCKAIKKFLAYDSFYPSERSVDCTKQFYASYGPFVNESSDDPVAADGFRDKAAFQNLMDPLFAPGVLYNTIKAGVACDWPMWGTSIKILNSSSHPQFHAIDTTQAQERIPFEALLEPEKYLSNKDLVSHAAHPSGTLKLITGSWDGSGDNLYTKMMSNFLAEIPDFFLEGNSLTSIASDPQGSENFGLAKPGKFYGMRLKMFSSREAGNPFFKRVEHSSSWYGGYTPPQSRGPQETITMYSRPSAFGPPTAGYRIDASDTWQYDSRQGINYPYTPPYYDGEAWIDFTWRAPILTSPTASQVSLMAGIATNKYTISEIMSNVTSSALRIDPYLNDIDLFGLPEVRNGGPISTSNTVANNTSTYVDQFNIAYYAKSRVRINANAMQLWASLNPMGIGKLVVRDNQTDTILNPNQGVAIDISKGDPEARWIIQTKMETPILNFQNSSSAVSTGSPNLPQSQTPRGMWHQHGPIPEANEGIYLQVTDLPISWLKYKNNTHETDLNDGWEDMGSLADLCGFGTNPTKLGQVSKGKLVKEAVVAIPYIEDGGIKKFFEINEDNYNNAKKYFQAVAIVNKGGDPSKLGLGNPEFWEQRSGASIIDQVRKMKEYIFPPTLNFVDNPEVTPFSMYIFEFNHTLSQQDLADIWQGLPPEIGVTSVKSESTVSHPLIANQLLGSGTGTDTARTGQDLNSEIRWMVFKVKQKAKTNYFDKVIAKKAGYGTAAQAAGFSTNAQNQGEQEAKISYNWPYDFFSLVELVKIDAEIEFADIEFPKPDTSKTGKFTPKRTEIPEGVQNFQASLSGVRRK
tara:strand:- start:10101 stop:14213 length:4113 start_codon:yes stop_codon:yes gene_type:complete